MIIYKDRKFNFNEIFNEKNGFLVRTNVLDETGNETNISPTMRSFPELIDIGIMGKCHVYKKYCKKFGIECYQKKDSTNMTIELYKKIIEQCKDKVFQIALGGKGDPNKHENFEEILITTRKNNIVPNLTTTGINITKNEMYLIKKYVGAVAISLYSKLTPELEEDNFETINAIKNMVDNNIITNIHYVINNNTIDDAIKRLKYNKFPNGINAVIFLLYKREQQELSIDKEKIIIFFDLINKNQYSFKIGFDTCFSPLIAKYLLDAENRSIEKCEAGTFSCYISPDGILYPCSFVQNSQFGIDIKNIPIIEAWNSKTMNKFRVMNINLCKNCNNKCRIYGCKAGLNQYVCKG